MMKLEQHKKAAALLADLVTAAEGLDTFLLKQDRKRKNLHTKISGKLFLYTLEGLREQLHADLKWELSDIMGEAGLRGVYFGDRPLPKANGNGCRRN